MVGNLDVRHLLFNIWEGERPIPVTEALQYSSRATYRSSTQELIDSSNISLIHTISQRITRTAGSYLESP